jgi:hypothetical protein
VRPFTFPYGQGLNADAGVQQDVVGNVVHRHFGLNEMTGLAFENDGHVCIAFIMRRAACTAAKQDGLLRGIGLRHARSECAGGLRSVLAGMCGVVIGLSKAAGYAMQPVK